MQTYQRCCQALQMRRSSSVWVGYSGSVFGAQSEAGMCRILAHWDVPSDPYLSADVGVHVLICVVAWIWNVSI